MADRVDIKLKATDPTGANTNTTISYVNPKASNSDMKTFAQRLNALTRNTYKESDKIETTNLDFAPDSHQQTPTLTLSATSMSKATVLAQTAQGNGLTYSFNQSLADITYDGDGQLFAYCSNKSGWFGAAVSVDSENKKLMFFAAFPTGSWENVFTAPVTIKVCSTATDHYKAAEVEFTITA